MKKILFSALLVFAANSYAQVGLTTVRTNEPVPVGQWYHVNAKWGKNRVFFYDLKANTDSILNQLLAPWDLTLANGEKDDAGDLFWFVDNDNGYSATIFRIDEGEYVMLQIISEPYEKPIEATTPKTKQP
jgi:hypothetical protein